MSEQSKTIWRIVLANVSQPLIFLFSYNKEAEDSIFEANRIDQMINSRRAQSRGLRQRNLAKNKEHFKDIISKLSISRFEDEILITEDQINK